MYGSNPDDVIQMRSDDFEIHGTSKLSQQDLEPVQQAAANRAQ